MTIIKKLKKIIKTSNTEKTTYITTTDIAKHFNISARKLNTIFEKLKWAKKQEKWWIATELGLTKGAKQEYNPKNKQKFIKWNSKIKNNFDLKNAINNIQENIKEETKNIHSKITNTKKEILKTEQKTKTMTRQEKKIKGDIYEEYIAKFFRKQGYYVWEHGKEKGVHDSSIDLLIKKEKIIYFVQCKNWENWKINHKEVKATRTDVNDYLKKEKGLWELIKDYDSKILYITPKACLTKNAYAYIKENNNIVDYQIIPMENI